MIRLSNKAFKSDPTQLIDAVVIGNKYLSYANGEFREHDLLTGEDELGNSDYDLVYLINASFDAEIQLELGPLPGLRFDFSKRHEFKNLALAYFEIAKKRNEGHYYFEYEGEPVSVAVAKTVENRGKLVALFNDGSYRFVEQVELTVRQPRLLVSHKGKGVATLTCTEEIEKFFSQEST
jgi:hypothetical protein